jgi:hypothetical protein
MARESVTIASFIKFLAGVGMRAGKLLLIAVAAFGAGWFTLAVAQDTEKPKARKAHWAFNPIAPPVVPHVKGRAETDIDRFVLAALEAKGQGINRETDRANLIRRISFDLTGLPPTLAEIDAFIADKSADAYERVINHYLKSPRYGERWGKYWLDTVGYADSNGYFSADSDRPHAWRYRDYVIRSFNEDKSFARFVQEQLAGDELAGYQPGGDITPAMAELLTATHFLRNAPDGTGESDGNPDEVRIDRYTVLEGTLQITMNSLLGLTIQCARCHKHKFEPITLKEYYQLQAIFFPAYNPERWKQPKDRIVEIGTKKEREDWKRITERIDQEIKASNAKLAASERTFREQLLRERLKDVEAPIQDKIIAAVNAPVKKRSKEQSDLLKKHASATQVSADDIAKRFPEFAMMRDDIKKSIAEREKERPRPLEKLSVFVETDPKPPPHHVLLRGQHNQPGEEVQPGVPNALVFPSNVFGVKKRPDSPISTGRRTAFADWITAPQNPLFARVLANRIWQHHFGIGLSATPDNLGQSGARPSHPELLDYLANEFVKSGWSVKHLHRLILRSAVYKQASTPRPELDKLDPDNRLLGRFPLRRLDAEAIRDGLLSVAGDLDLRVGGAYVPTKRTKDGVVEVADSQDGARRRSVYLQQRRTQVLTLLQLFDAPSIVGPCSTRTTSTIPLQSLALLNSKFIRDRAVAFEQRLTKEVGADAKSRVQRAFRLACGRLPEADESAATERFLAAQRKVYGDVKDRETRAWVDLCQMVLASNAFMYVE